MAKFCQKTPKMSNAPLFLKKIAKNDPKSRNFSKKSGQSRTQKIRSMKRFIAILTDLEEVYLNILEAVEHAR